LVLGTSYCGYPFYYQTGDEIIQTLLCFCRWSLYQNWRILAIVRHGSCLLVSEPYTKGIVDF